MRNKVTGDYPASLNEMCISKYLAEVLLTANSDVYAVKEDDKGNISYEMKVDINSVNDVVGKTVVLNLRGDRQKDRKSVV